MSACKRFTIPKIMHGNFSEVNGKKVPSHLPTTSHRAVLTFDEEEEADDAHSSDDEAGDDEGQAPVGGDPVTCDQRAQDVAH